MKLLETKDGVSYFTLEHNPAYQAVEMKFLDAVESLRPDNIVVCSFNWIATITLRFTVKCPL